VYSCTVIYYTHAKGDIEIINVRKTITM